MSRSIPRPLVYLVLAGLAAGLSLHGLSTSAHAHPVNTGRGTLIVDYTADISHLDTGKCYDYECSPFIRAMYDRLVDYQGTSVTLAPDAAAAMPTVTNAGKTYTFALRRDVHFWNGKLVTPADWVYSFERIINPKTQAGAASFWMNIVGANSFAKGRAKHVSGIQTIGKWGLRIRLIKPDASFLNVLAMQFGSVVDRAAIERYGKSYDSEHPMGTGPYMFKEHQLGRRLVLVQNPHYFKREIGDLAQIEADFGVNPSTALLRIERGQADLDGDQTPISAADFNSVRQDPKWSKQLDREQQVATFYIPLNTLMKPFTNVLVRRAVNMAINKPQILRLMQGRGSVTNTMLPPLMPGHGNFNLYPYNPPKARQLMARAGYAGGVSTTFYTDNVPDDQRVAQAILPMLSSIGIKANLRVVDQNTLITLIGTKRKVPLTWVSWFMDFPDPNDFFEPILSCASVVPGTFNISWYCDPKVDRLANKLKAMTNRGARLAQYPRLDRMMMQDAPIVPVLNPVRYELRSTAVKRIAFNPVWWYVFTNMVKS